MGFVKIIGSGLRFVYVNGSTYFVYSIFTDAPVVRFNYSSVLSSNIKLIDILDNTNLALIVYDCSPHKVKVWDDEKKRDIAELETTAPILSLRIRREYMFIVTEVKIFVYSLGTYKHIYTLETASNPRGLLEITPQGKIIIATIGVNPRDIVIRCLDHSKDELMTYISSVSISPIRCLSLSSDGMKVATTSEKGTLFRVFDTMTGSRLRELRRGISSTIIYSMALNDTVLMVIGESKTVHWYDLLSLPPVPSFLVQSQERSIDSYTLTSTDYASTCKDCLFTVQVTNGTTDSLVICNTGDYIAFRGMKVRERGKYCGI